MTFVQLHNLRRSYLAQYTDRSCQVRKGKTWNKTDNIYYSVAHNLHDVRGGTKKSFRFFSLCLTTITHKQDLFCCGIHGGGKTRRQVLGFSKVIFTTYA